MLRRKEAICCSLMKMKENKKTRKQDRKANRIVTLDGGNCQEVQIINLIKASHKQIYCRNHKAALNEKPTDSPL